MSADHPLIDKKSNDTDDIELSYYFAVGDLGIDDVIKRIQFFANEQDDFDIYQICAFQVMQRPMSKYFFTVCKAILCLLIQLPSLAYIMIKILEESEKDWCTLDDDNGWIINPMLQWLKFGFSMYLSFAIFGLIQKSGHQGMYCVFLAELSNLPDCLNGLWLQIGGFYNGVVLYCAIYGSFCIIFFSEDALDLVLNALALLFIVEIDNLMVDNGDYQEIQQFLKTYVHATDYGINPPQTKCCKTFWWTVQIVILIVLYITQLFAFVSPFYTAVCS